MTLMERQRRAAEVHAAMRAFPAAVGAAEVARLLNLKARCPWCSVLPPRDGERCAAVPRGSRDKAERILECLEAWGVVREIRAGRHRRYAVSEAGGKS